jgi:hypothetical protein
MRAQDRTSPPAGGGDRLPNGVPCQQAGPLVSMFFPTSGSKQRTRLETLTQLHKISPELLEPLVDFLRILGSEPYFAYIPPRHVKSLTRIDSVAASFLPIRGP